MLHMHAMSAMVVDSTTGCHVFVEYPQPGEIIVGKSRQLTCVLLSLRKTWTCSDRLESNTL